MFSQVITRVVLCERPDSNPHACTHIVAEGGNLGKETKPSHAEPVPLDEA